MSAPDVLRVVVLVPLCAVFGATLTVLRLYWRAWLELPREQARLTPLHVALVSVGVLLLTSALAWALLVGLSAGQPVDALTAVRIGMYGLGAVCILAALWVIGAKQRRRVRFERVVVVHVAEDGERSG